MEDSLFSQPEMKEASKNFVCIRLNCHEDKDNLALLLKLRKMNNDPDYLTNNDLFLLDPTGEKVLFRKGSRTYLDFIEQVGGLKGVLAAMDKAIKQYPGKLSQAALVPWNKSLSSALVRSHADGEPVLLLITDGSEELKAIEKAIGDPSLVRRFSTEFYFVRVAKGSEDVAKLRLPEDLKLMFLRPARLGTDAIIMDTKADPKNLAKSMAAARDEFGKTFRKLSRSDTLRIGYADRIFYKGPGSNPGAKD